MRSFFDLRFPPLLASFALRNPLQWHEEFIFTLPNTSQNITLQLYDWNRILKNVPLGQATLEPSRVNTNVGLDMWLPFDTQGEVHIFVQATPLSFSPPKAKQLRLGSFRMNVERVVYFPGEIIRGAVIYNVGKPKKIRGVRVRFSGSTKTHWSESRTDSEGRQRTIWFDAHYTFFDPVATLYGNERGQKKDFKIPSGGYFYPFEFCLPFNLAPSFYGKFGENNYYVKGYVDIPMAIDKTVTQKLTMTCQYSTIHPTLTVKYAKKAKSAFASDQHISVEFAAAEIAYMGEPFPINVSIDHRGSKDVKELKIKLKSKHYFSAKNHEEGWKTRKVKKEVLVHKVANIAGFPIPPGTLWQGQVLVPVPGALACSVPEDLSPIVQVVYYFSVEMSTTGNAFTKASNKKKLPILLGERIPFQPVFYQAPPPPQHYIQAVQPQIMVAPPPADVYQYLAPQPFMGDEISPCAHVMPHDAFVAQQPFQPPQWAEADEGAVVMDANAYQFQATLSDARD